jgi:hypothetical protein
MVEVTENKMVSRFESGWKCQRDHTAPQTNRNTDMVNRLGFGANVPDLFKF